MLGFECSSRGAIITSVRAVRRKCEEIVLGLQGGQSSFVAMVCLEVYEKNTNGDISGVLFSEIRILDYRLV